MHAMTSIRYTIGDDKMTSTEQARELLDQIEALMVRAETGAEWAEICRMETEYVALTGKQVM